MLRLPLRDPIPWTAGSSIELTWTCFRVILKLFFGFILGFGILFRCFELISCLSQDF